MKKRAVIFLFLLLAMVAFALSMSTVKAINTWTVDDDLADFPGANFRHIQDAINAATPGDTILVYPGTYSERYSPPMWGSPSGSDVWAPAVIVYKDGLTIKAVDSDPTKTVIQSRHAFWSNPLAIQISTNYNVNPVDGTAPHAVIIIANYTTIDGFTIIRAYDGTYGTFNSAPVFIGDLLSGGSQFLNKVHDNTVKNCILGTNGYWFNTSPPPTYPAPDPYIPVYNGPVNSWTGLYIWKSSNNEIINNVGHDVAWRAFNVYDGSSDSEINLGSLSKGNQFTGNELYNAWGGISVGAWGPATKLTDNTGTVISGNYLHDLTDSAIMFTYSNSSDVSMANNRIENCPSGIMCYSLVSMPRITVDTNKIKTMTYWGIVLNNASNGMISRNLVDQCGGTTNRGAVRLENCYNVQLNCNNFTNSYRGLITYTSTGIRVRSNIMGNTNGGVYNTNADPSYLVDALCCYWGDPSGPYHPTANPTGLGNSVSDNVLFNPWLHWYACAMCPLTVSSAYDSPNPPVGTTSYLSLTSVTASVTSPWPLAAVGTRYVCTDWSGSGSVPSSGTGTTVTFTIDQPSSITWNWKTQYYLTVKTDPIGAATIAGQGWYDAGAAVPLTAPPVSGSYRFLYWDVDGTSQGSNVNPITVHMSPHTATAHYSNSAVGGEWAPINTVQLVAPWITLALIAIAGAGAASYRLLKKRW